MRTSEQQKRIDADPKFRLAQLKSEKGSGVVTECRSGKLWIYHKVKNGIDHYKVYDLHDKVIKRGIAK